MFKKAKRDVFINRIVFRQDQCDLEHALAVECHPCRTIGLVQMTTHWKLRTAIKYPDVVQTEKSACKNIPSLRIFPINPPVEVLHQSLERSLEKSQVRTSQFFLNVVEEQCSPSMHWRIYVAKIPFICRDLPVRVCV